MADEQQGILSKYWPDLLGLLSGAAGAKAAGAATAAKSIVPSKMLSALFLSNPAFGINGRREHHIFDDNFNRVGKMTVQPKGTDLWVHSISGPEGLSGASIKNQLGPTEIRSLIGALKDEYPDIETISGDRITGIRHGPAADPTIPENEYNVTSVRVRPPFEQRQQQEVDRLTNDPNMQEIVRRNMQNIKF